MPQDAQPDRPPAPQRLPQAQSPPPGQRPEFPTATYPCICLFKPRTRQGTTGQAGHCCVPRAFQTAHPPHTRAAPTPLPGLHTQPHLCGSSWGGTWRTERVRGPAQVTQKGPTGRSTSCQGQGGPVSHPSEEQRNHYPSAHSSLSTWPGLQVGSHLGEALGSSSSCGVGRGLKRRVRGWPHSRALWLDPRGLEAPGKPTKPHAFH